MDFPERVRATYLEYSDGAGSPHKLAHFYDFVFFIHNLIDKISRPNRFSTIFKWTTGLPVSILNWI